MGRTFRPITHGPAKVQQARSVRKQRTLLRLTKRKGRHPALGTQRKTTATRNVQQKPAAKRRPIQRYVSAHATQKGVTVILDRPTDKQTIGDKKDRTKFYRFD